MRTCLDCPADISHRYKNVKRCEVCRDKREKEKAAEASRQWKADHPEYAREYRAANPEKRKRYNAKWQKANPDKVRAKQVRRYGLTPEQYSDMLTAQGGLCAICRNTCEVHKHLSIDHCHKTGAVRGLLCTACNSGIGRFGDDPDLLTKAAAYLRSKA